MTLAAVLLSAVASGPSVAAEAVALDWDCERCPQTSGWELAVDLGPAYINDDAFRFGDYTGLDEQGWNLFGDLFARYWSDDADYMVFEGYSRGPDSNALFVKGGKQSLFELRADYQAIPRRIFDTTVTPYAGNGTGRLALPPSWVRAPTTGQMTALSGTAAPVAIGWDWDVYGLGVDLSPGQRWGFSADFARRQGKGQNRSSASFFFSAVEFAAPLEYTTDDLEIALSYAVDSWQASLSYFGSVFRSDNADLVWDNPYIGATGADTGQLALPPDNESHQVSLAGSLILPGRTTLNGQLSVGQLTQNDALLPYTTNALIPTNPLPTGAANAEVDTLNLNLRAVSSPWRQLTVEGELRYNDFDNKTPINTYDYVVTDTRPASTPVESTAYDYERRDIRLRGEYRLARGRKLQAGFDNERFERNRQERLRTTTNRLWLRWGSRLGKDANIDVDVFAEDRDGSTYAAVSNPAAQQNPLMRKYNMSDRERGGIKVRGSILASERSDLALEFEFSKDNYRDSPIGLTDSEYLRLGAEFAYVLSGAASAHASFYTEQIDTDQRNSQAFALPNWSATTRDRFTVFTVGVDYPEILGPVGASFDYTWSKSLGEIANNTSGLASMFPDLRSTRQNIRLGLVYPRSEALTFGFDYFFEKLDTSDWHLDGVEPATVTNLLSLGADTWNYDVGVFYFSVQYRL